MVSAAGFLAAVIRSVRSRMVSAPRVLVAAVVRSIIAVIVSTSFRCFAPLSRWHLYWTPAGQGASRADRAGTGRDLGPLLPGTIRLERSANP
ncbi:hypothetical protein Vqi01_02350 [Micromonospora qiuiae]|uniref:Secreted protein n=1 Tax=Micromonospora qiuiae TaxID=502268 RepID=A0ABQ4J4I2_9ACTN|nr:hypothetical protein Vqi01_02350 [Micromonospora qiuiae]